MDATKYLGGSALLNAKSLRERQFEGKTLTVSKTEERDFKDEKKLVLSFFDIEESLALNQTNLSILIDEFGAETGGWNGRKISLNLVKSKFQGQTVDSIQIKPVGGDKA